MRREMVVRRVIRRVIRRWDVIGRKRKSVVRVMRKVMRREEAKEEGTEEGGAYLQ